MPLRNRCDICDCVIAPHGHYLVRIDVLADPSIPEVSSNELEEIDFDETFRSLIEQMENMSEDELQDQVFRRFRFNLCPTCQREFLANPLGMPRRKAVGEN